MDLSTTFQSLFKPRTIVFIGASQDFQKWGFTILHNIIKGGFQGHVYPVNPGGGSWYGRRVYVSLDEIEDPIDLAVIVVAQEHVLATVLKCVEKRIPAGIIITAGFSETGNAGTVQEEEIIRAARAGGMRLVGPNTMGVYSGFPSPMQAIMAAVRLLPGPVGLVVQSGNLGVSISSRFSRRNIGISRLISSGNEGDLNTGDYLELLEIDANTKLICLYVEGIRLPDRFLQIARRVAAKKPVLLLKGGRSPSGALAARSHTGALAGDDRIFRGICRQSGIVQVETIDEMVDIAGMFLTQPKPRGNRVGIITLGGGWGVLATDLCAYHGLKVPALNEDLINRINAVLPSYWSRGNPVDLVAPNRISSITDVAGILLEDDSMDAVLMLGLGYITMRARRLLDSPIIPAQKTGNTARALISAEIQLLDLIIEQIRQTGKPIIPVLDIEIHDEVMENNPAKYLEQHGIMAYTAPDQAIRALGCVVRHTTRHNQVHQEIT
ncbi:MAG: CoA-binding protein [Deltaproteobacteria bacterium]|nr:CoA-binding protein [Deltaproteobacteria bacterium]